MYKGILFLFISLNALAADLGHYQDLAVGNRIDHAKRVVQYQKVLNNTLSRFDLYPMVDQNLPEFYFADYVYQNKKEIFAIRFSLEFPGKLNKKLVQFQEGYLYHFGDVAVYFKTRNKKRAQLLMDTVRNQVSKIKVSSNFSFFPKAYAADSPVCDTTSLYENSPLSDQEQVVEEANIAFYLGVMGNCMMNALRGAWENTRSTVSSVGSGIVSFFRNPVKSISRAWDSTVNMVNATADFFRHFQTHMTELGEVLRGIDGETIGNILCSLVVAVGGMTLLNMVLNPAVGTAALIARLASVITRITGLGRVLRMVARLRSIAGAAGVNMSKVIQNLIVNTNSRFQRTIRRLSERGDNRLLLEYAECAI